CKFFEEKFQCTVDFLFQATVGQSVVASFKAFLSGIAAQIYYLFLNFPSIQAIFFVSLQIFTS
ncbi:hypothetical protein, partial [Muribaculum intestinale]|uniref:hypothetical protein n=1 Tax=Muribaculum intestinale TaxID=1796646 RepID=UPI0025AF5648